MNALREMLNGRYEQAVLFDAASDARDAAAEIAHPAWTFIYASKCCVEISERTAANKSLENMTHKARLVGKGAESREKPDVQHGRKDFSHKGGWQGDSDPLLCMALGGGLRRYVQQRR